MHSIIEWGAAYAAPHNAEDVRARMLRVVWIVVLVAGTVGWLTVCSWLATI